MSPSGRTSYIVANIAGQMQILPRNVASGAVGSPIASIPAADGLERIALSPNGSRAYVSGGGHIYPVTLSSGAVGSPIDAGAEVRALAVSQDGRFVYASVGQDVVKYDAATGAERGRVSLAQPAGAIKLTADGRTAYVVGDTQLVTSSVQLFKLSLAPFAISDSAHVPGNNGNPGATTLFGLALSPDQSTVYVTGSVVNSATEPDRAFVVPVRTSDLRVGSEIVVVDGDRASSEHLDLAFTPDGKTLYGYVDDRNAARYVWTVDTTTNTLSSKTASTPPSSFDHDANFSSVVVPSDQAPVAKFKATAACAGTATEFDASSSTVANGTIVRYAWNFGDGTTKVTTGPKVKHVYAKPGSYAATVTQTDSAGTSTTVVFDGQTVLRNGKPTARARHTVTITACAVSAPTIPSSGSMAASSADASLPMTGGNTTEALILSGLLIGVGAVLTRAGRRVRG